MRVGRRREKRKRELSLFTPDRVGEFGSVLVIFPAVEKDTVTLPIEKLKVRRSSRDIPSFCSGEWHQKGG